MDPIATACTDLQDTALETLLDLLRIPSVTAEPEHRDDLLACARSLESLFKERGYRTRRLDAAGFPTIVAELGPADGPAVLLYGHYDVQPAHLEDGWSSDPFDPVLIDGAIRCRGSADDKGPLLATIFGVEAYRAARGEPPCRVIFLCEGAEEIGSPGFEEVLLAERENLRADMAVIADCWRLIPERPGVLGSLRGLAYLEVFLQGPNVDLHSGNYGGTLDNPAQVLANMLSALKDADRRVAIPGFYDAVVAPTEDELAAIAAVPFDEEDYRAQLGVPCLAGESGYSTLVRRWLRPALDIHGITAGFQGEGPKTVLPARASAKISCRLVHDQDPDAVLTLMEEFLRQVAPPSVSISFRRHSGARPVKLDLSGPEAEWLYRALERAYRAKALTVPEGATVPVVNIFNHKLGIPAFPVGFCRIDDGAHGPDERFFVEDLNRAILSTAYLLDEIAGQGA